MGICNGDIFAAAMPRSLHMRKTIENTHLPCLAILVSMPGKHYGAARAHEQRSHALLAVRTREAPWRPCAPVMAGVCFRLS